MARLRRYSHLLLSLALVLIAILVAALWFYGAQPRPDPSPLPTPMTPRESPLSTPDVENTTVSPPPPSSWATGGAVLLWVALGILLALGLALIILRWYHRTV